MRCEVNKATCIEGGNVRHCRRCERPMCMGCSRLVGRLIWSSNGECMFTSRRPVRECLDCADKPDDDDDRVLPVDAPTPPPARSGARGR